VGVQFLPMQGPGRWEELMQASDVLLVNQRASVADMSLPSKLTSYFPAARPVVAAVAPDSETPRLRRRAAAARRHHPCRCCGAPNAAGREVAIQEEKRLSGKC
jgi:hypothetical protein